MEGNGSYSFYVASNGNTVLDNTVVVGDNPYSTTMGAVRIDGDDNRVSGNTLAAANEVVRVSAGADDNTFTKNRVTTGLVGFWVEANTFRNIFSDNTALFIGGTSAVDRSGACVNNTWTKNAFMTTDPVCILAVTLDAVGRGVRSPDGFLDCQGVAAGAPQQPARCGGRRCVVRGFGDGRHAGV